MSKSEIPERPNYKTRQKERKDPFAKVVSFMPESTVKLLKNESLLRTLPMSRLIAIVVDKAVDTPDAFDLDLEMPNFEFTENAYANEAVKIFDFLKSVPSGIGIDSLWLFRREIGIMNKEYFMAGYRELLRSGMIEEFVPYGNRFNHSKDYRYIRVTGTAKLRKDYK